MLAGPIHGPGLLERSVTHPPTAAQRALFRRETPQISPSTCERVSPSRTWRRSREGVCRSCEISPKARGAAAAVRSVPVPRPFSISVAPFAHTPLIRPPPCPLGPFLPSPTSSIRHRQPWLQLSTEAAAPYRAVPSPWELGRIASSAIPSRGGSTPTDLLRGADALRPLAFIAGRIPAQSALPADFPAVCSCTCYY